MLRNYLIIALRVLFRQKIYSLINVSGLAVGIAATLLIAVYIADEASYDRFHKDADSIYRLVSVGRQNGLEVGSAKIGDLWAEAIQNEFPGIQSVLRVSKMIGEDVVYCEDKEFSEKNLIYADSNFFDFFSFQLVKGNTKDALKGPNKAVITESGARKYFGYQGGEIGNPVGKTLLLTVRKTPVEITGIVKDPPAQSHFHFDIIASLEAHPNFKSWNSWLGTFCYTYFKTVDPYSVIKISNSSPYLLGKYAEAELNKYGSSVKKLSASGDDFTLVPQPLVDIHLDSHLSNQELEANGSREYLHILAVIALLIVALACINFINLSTARAACRAKEVGIRKTIGAVRSRLARQFMLESFMYCALAFLLAMGLVSLSLGAFNLLTGKEFVMTDFGRPWFVFSIFVLLVLVTILAGTYPAFYLTTFKPSEVLKGRIYSFSRGSGTRNVLVIFQFMISASLIIASLVIRNQIEFMRTRDPGFNPSNVVCISNAYALNGKLMPFKSDLQGRDGIMGVSFSSRLPSHRFNQAVSYRKWGTEQWQAVYYNYADVDHAKVLDIRLAEGRFFSDQFPSDSIAVLINRAAANLLGIQGLIPKEYIDNAEGKYEVIGITEDFNFESLRTEVKPLIIFFGDPYYLSKAAIRIEGRDFQSEIETIKTVWCRYSSAPFEYTFLDDNLVAQYKSEELLSRIAMVFTSLAIIIACIGLLGLVTYVTSQRTKEIGIRKVLGANIAHIVTLVSRDFVRLIIVALIIAVPVTWYFASTWLDKFAYHIDFSLVLAGISAGIVMIVALATISFQAITAALGNPSDSLRTE